MAAKSRAKPESIPTPAVLPDPEQIFVREAVFLECLISNPSEPPIGSTQVGGFTEPVVVVLPFFLAERNLVWFEVQVMTQAIDTEGTELPLTGSFRAHLSFEVANLPELLRPTAENAASVPSPELSALLVGAAYSTVRGMIMSKVADTVLGGFALPLRSIRRLMHDSNEVLRERKNEAPVPAAPKRTRKSRQGPPSII